MSLKAQAWAWDAQGLSPYEKLVLLYLAHLATPDRTCWPGKEVIAAAWGCSKRKVDYCLKTLADLGFIHIMHRQIGHGSITNVYRIESPEES